MPAQVLFSSSDLSSKLRARSGRSSLFIW
ncbi:unnamed protein product [Larinioides sclopetarius]|uniref:Uncharacterized protein n=1 Tax=Larinioides sclopetarius TaxID=280406 RepID=A0AAV1ZDY6_9ARAC